MSEIRELSMTEIDDVNGGILPAIPAAIFVVDLALISFGVGFSFGYLAVMNFD